MNPIHKLIVDVASEYGEYGEYAWDFLVTLWLFEWVEERVKKASVRKLERAEAKKGMGWGRSQLSSIGKVIGHLRHLRIRCPHVLVLV